MSAEKIIPAFACLGKVRHTSRAAAHRHMLLLRRAKSPAEGRMLHVYRCPHSGGGFFHWHVGHKLRCRPEGKREWRKCS